MGLLDIVKNEFIDVIEFVDETNKLIVHKYTRSGNEIKQGSKVIVRESQVAIFLKSGQLADILPSGSHTLNTENLPILSKLEAFKFGFNSPIKSDLYFISLKQFIDNKWATKNPIMVRDNDMNMVRITSFGKFSFHITDSVQFMREVFGTLGKVMTYDIVQYLSSLIAEAFAVIIGELNIPVLDLAVKYQDISTLLLSRANERIQGIGIEISKIIIENISLPEEVEKLIDEQSGIGMASKNMDTFMQYQTARAMRDAASQEGGLAGLGAGMALGNSMTNTINTSANEQTSSPDNISQLRELKLLLDEGILSQEEFDTKKKQLLGL